MKIRRFFIVMSVVVMTLIATNVVTTSFVKLKYVQSYPAIVCPPTDKSVSSQVSVSTTQVPFRKIAGNLIALRPIKTTRYSLSKDAILLDQGAIGSLTWQNVPGVWAGSTLCRAPQGDQWFVGGTANIIGKGRLYLVNSGLSDAIVDVAIWSEIGPQTGKVLTIPANSSMAIPLDSFAAGASSLTLRVTSRSGRVNSFLIDERKKGLTTLGGDTVNSVDFPRTDMTIGGIPHQIIKGKHGSNILRVLVPGNVNANIRVDSISKDGVFVPVGLDGKDIPFGKVVDIPLSPTIASSAFSLRIRSDQPLVAGVFTALQVNGHQDIVWSPVDPVLVPMTIAVTGLTPTLIFTGDQIDLEITTNLFNGKSVNSHVIGKDIVIWKVPDKARTITFSKIQGVVVGSGLISSVSGVGTFPLSAGSTLNRAAIPVSDIGVINR